MAKEQRKLRVIESVSRKPNTALGFFFHLDCGHIKSHYSALDLDAMGSAWVGHMVSCPSCDDPLYETTGMTADERAFM